MKALKNCKWVFEISEFCLSEEKNFRWSAITRDMEKNKSRFANGGIGHISCIRLFQTTKQIKDHIKEFIKVNAIKNYKIIKKEE